MFFHIYQEFKFRPKLEGAQLNGARLSDGHLTRLPHGAVKCQRPSLPHSLVYIGLTSSNIGLSQSED